MNQVVFLVIFLLAACVWGQQQQGPLISTENGNLRISSPGNLMFQAGNGGEVQFMGSDGEPLIVGEEGEKGEKGDLGDIGVQGNIGLSGSPGLMGDMGVQGSKGVSGMNGINGIKGVTGSGGTMGLKGNQGVRGVSATDSSLVTWNECAWKDMNEGKDYGHIATCSLNKMRNDTWLQITWIGNTRITRCQRCCMRWYFTINGEECADPGPIDMVIYQAQNFNALRQSILSGSCRATKSIDGERVLTDGAMRVQFNIMECFNFGGFVYDAYTGWNSVSRISVQEIIPREVSVPEVRVHPPAEYVYRPNYCQYFFAHLGINRERNVGIIATAIFKKEHDHTVLRIAWEGNLRKKSCSNCCTRWWIQVDGSPCSNFERIETSITSSTAQDIFVPTTIKGMCYEADGLPISEGKIRVSLVVGVCEGFTITNSGSGFYSSSRLVVEELPVSRDPLVKPTNYHPQWAHCAIFTDNDTNEGAISETKCSFNKTASDSSLRVTYNGVLRLTNCQDCCMRWFVTLNGVECDSPAPIEAIINGTDLTQFSLHRGAIIVGICGGIESGTVEAILNVGQCSGSNETFDTHTGLNAPSTMTLEEMPAPKSDMKGFYPQWNHCATEMPLDHFINASDLASVNETIQLCSYTKTSMNTSLKISWDGNVGVIDCNRCCMRWYITIDGEECLSPGPIDAALVQDLGSSAYRYDLIRPASIFGICHQSGTQLGIGTHTVELHVGFCEDASGLTTPPGPSDTITGLNSVSRFVIEEIPRERDECLTELVQPRR